MIYSKITIKFFSKKLLHFRQFLSGIRASLVESRSKFQNYVMELPAPPISIRRMRNLTNHHETISNTLNIISSEIGMKMKMGNIGLKKNVLFKNLGSSLHKDILSVIKERTQQQQLSPIPHSTSDYYVMTDIGMSSNSIPISSPTFPLIQLHHHHLILLVLYLIMIKNIEIDHYDLVLICIHLVMITNLDFDHYKTQNSFFYLV